MSRADHLTVEANAQHKTLARQALPSKGKSIRRFRHAECNMGWALA